GLKLVRGGQERRGVAGHPDDLDAVRDVEQRPDPLPYQNVVVGQKDPDGHASISPLAIGSARLATGSIPSWRSASCSRRTTTWFAKAPPRCFASPRISNSSPLLKTFPVSWPPSRTTSRTPSSPTSGCLPPTRPKGSRRPGRSGPG